MSLPKQLHNSPQCSTYAGCTLLSKENHLILTLRYKQNESCSNEAIMIYELDLVYRCLLLLHWPAYIYNHDNLQYLNVNSRKTKNKPFQVPEKWTNTIKNDLNNKKGNKNNMGRSA